MGAISFWKEEVLFWELCSSKTISFPRKKHQGQTERQAFSVFAVMVTSGFGQEARKMPPLGKKVSFLLCKKTIEYSKPKQPSVSLQQSSYSKQPKSLPVLPEKTSRLLFSLFSSIPEEVS